MRFWTWLFWLVANAAHAQAACVPPAAVARAACSPESGPPLVLRRVHRNGVRGRRADRAAQRVARAISQHDAAQRGAVPRRAGLERAVTGYDAILEGFPDLDALDLSALPVDLPAPTRAGIVFYRADALWSLRRWQACADAMDGLGRRFALDADAAFLAAVCHHHAHLASARPRDADRRRAHALQRFACTPGDHDPVETRYQLGRLHFDAGRFEDAAVVMEDIALRFPLHDVASEAARLWLASLDGLSGRACREARARAADQLRPLYCRGSARAEAPSALCRRVREAGSRP